MSDREYILGRCGTCDMPTDRLPCPFCVLVEITSVDEEGQPVHSQAEMFRLADDATSWVDEPAVGANTNKALDAFGVKPLDLRKQQQQ